MGMLRFLMLAGRKPTESLRDRAAALRSSAARAMRREPLGQAGNDRRVLIAGSLAAAVPLPALAFSSSPTTDMSPDAALLVAGDRYFRAKAAETEIREAYGEAWMQVYPVLKTCPPSLLVTREEKFAVLGGWRWPSRLGLNLRHLAVRPEELGVSNPDHFIGEAWTGKALEAAICQAVPLLGRGGQTPHRIRRWRQMLTTAQTFDAKVEAVEAASRYRELCRARRVLEKELDAARLDLHGMVATTPKGLAIITQLVGSYSWKDMGCGMPNLLRSAANVSGVALADLEHRYASTRTSAEG